MRIAVFDCPSGIAGDMWVGACLDAGLPLAVLRAAIDSLELGVTVRAERVRRAGLVGTWFRVEPAGGGREPTRGLAEVTAILERAEVPLAVRVRALAVFGHLADAESAAHDLPRERVHFHEVGAIDTIVDVLCACFAVHELGIEMVYASAVEVGRGRVRCVHGVLPVPAPAAASLMHGFRQRRRLDGERTTPTGAALLREFVDPRSLCPEFRSEVCGYGAGTRDDPEVPNLVRVTLGSASCDPATDLFELACNLDTADGETLAWCVEQALAAGAVDAWVVPITMKKGRPGHLLGALVDAARREQVSGVLLEESSSLGVRCTRVERSVLERWEEVIDGPCGAVRHKCARLPSGLVVKRPEDAELRRLCVELDLPRRTVLARLAQFASRGEGQAPPD